MSASILSSPLELRASTTRRVSPREHPSKDLTLTHSPEPEASPAPPRRAPPRPQAPPTEDR